MKKRFNIDIKVFIVFVIVMFSLFIYANASERIKKHANKMPYSSFEQQFNDGNVKSVTYSLYDDYMDYTLVGDKTIYSTYYPGNQDSFLNTMVTHGVDIENQEHAAVMSNLMGSVGSNIGQMILTVGLLYYMYMMYNRTNNESAGDLVASSDVRFDDIIGQSEVVNDLKFITKVLKSPQKYSGKGVEVPHGILLSGPPGTGKTMIAKAIAGEAGVPFIYANASNFVEVYVGVGAKRVRQLFRQARKNAPCIVFIDEIDSLGKRHGQKTGSEEARTVNALLQEMDGFNRRDGIFIIAATNSSKSLDDALVRAGRFDREVIINPPKDWEIRQDLFRSYLKDKPLSDDVDLAGFAKQTAGFTGADIKAVCNEAGIIAMMAEKEYIDAASLEEALDKKIFKGNHSADDSNNKVSKDRETVAYHEAGHAVMSYLRGQTIARASIIGTTSGVGGAVINEEHAGNLYTKEDLENQVMVAYAGRASEQIKFGKVTTGASNDITQATGIIVKYLEAYGFDDDFGLLDVSVLQESHVINSSDMTVKMSELSRKLYKNTLDLLNEHYNLVTVLAEKLLEKRSLQGDEIRILFEQNL